MLWASMQGAGSGAKAGRAGSRAGFGAEHALRTRTDCREILPIKRIWTRLAACIAAQEMELLVNEYGFRADRYPLRQTTMARARPSQPSTRRHCGAERLLFATAPKGRIM